ncbi:MAG: hypothetical protein QXE50_05715 [Nitrososphaerota archaeon]
MSMGISMWKGVATYHIFPLIEKYRRQIEEEAKKLKTLEELSKKIEDTKLDDIDGLLAEIKRLSETFDDAEARRVLEFIIPREEIVMFWKVTGGRFDSLEQMLSVFDEQ